MSAPIRLLRRRTALKQSEADQMRLYPDPTAHALNAAIAKAYGVEECQVFTGVGSDDVLAMIFLTFFNDNLPVLFPDITYAFYPVWCNLFRIPYAVQPLNDNFEIDPKDYEKPNGGIVFQTRMHRPALQCRLHQSNKS